ncbi:unnamed protein product, partial [Rotaria sp. Silwood1]
MEEGEFTFDALQQQLHSLDTKFCFSAEDSTGIIRKIKYNAKTNSFVGFLSPLDNGIPIPKSFKTNSFEELKIWYDTIEKAPLLNVHMVQPIPSISDQNKIPTSFILSAYGVNPSHLVTKWRNRLLSTTADLRLGQDRISIEHLQDIINSD